MFLKRFLATIENSIELSIFEITILGLTSNISDIKYAILIFLTLNM